MTTLYSITQEGMELNDILTATDGEITPELELRLDEWLKSGKGKIDAACKVVQSLTASADACLEESKRLNERTSSFLRNRDMLKDRILGAVDLAFGGKVKTDLFTVWGQTSADTFAVDIAADCDLKALHAADPELVKVGYALDKAKCRQLIKDGTEINGVTVQENPGKRYLRIK